MNKILGILLGSILGLASVSAADGWKLLPEDQGSLIKKAIELAVKEDQSKVIKGCTLVTEKNGETVVDDNFPLSLGFILQHPDIYENISSPQPLFKLTHLYDSNGENITSKILITTNDSYTEVIAVTALFLVEAVRTTEVNLGTIKDPNFKDLKVREVVSRQTATCSL